MGWPRLYANSVERKATWRRRQGMAVRPHSPSAVKHAVSRVQQRQAALALAARECAALQQALLTRALADQCWELHALIDDWSQDADMPHHVSEGRPSGLVAGVNTSFYGMAAARGRRHRRALQRMAHVRAPRAVQANGPHDAGSRCANAHGTWPCTAGG